MPVTPETVAANLMDESWLSRLACEILHDCLRPLKKGVLFSSDEGSGATSWNRSEFPNPAVSLTVSDFSEKKSEPDREGSGPASYWETHTWQELVLLDSGRFAVMSHKLHHHWGGNCGAWGRGTDDKEYQADLSELGAEQLARFRNTICTRLSELAGRAVGERETLSPAVAQQVLRSGREGVHAWNGWRWDRQGYDPEFPYPSLLESVTWRGEIGDRLPDLEGTDLRGLDLVAADLTGLRLVGARLDGANLTRADLKGSDLSGAVLTHARLVDAKIKSAILAGADFCGADLTGCDFTSSDLSVANLTQANLVRACLVGARLRGARAADADLTGADLSNADITRATFAKSRLSQCKIHQATGPHVCFDGADLTRADLRKACLQAATLREAIASHANLTGADFQNADFTAADLSDAAMAGADLRRAVFTDTVMRGADVTGARAEGARFERAVLTGMALGAMLNLRLADLTQANLTGLDLTGVDLREARLTGADMRGCDLSDVDLSKADLANCDLRGARLIRARLIGTDLRGSDLTGCHVFGVSAWDVRVDGADQSDLVVSPHGEPAITVDNINVAQFVYMMLNNPSLRNFIDSITAKLVLILGRWTPERLAVLNAVRENLRRRNYVPVMFDFDCPASRDVSETASTLAHLARFIVADLTDPRVVPQELQRIIPELPSVPVQPLLQGDSPAVASLGHFKRFHWVLPIARYRDAADLQDLLERELLGHLEAKLVDVRPQPGPQ